MPHHRCRRARLALRLLSPAFSTAVLLAGLLLSGTATGESAGEAPASVQLAEAYHVMFRTRTEAQKLSDQLRKLPAKAQRAALSKAALRQSLDRATARHGGYLGEIHSGFFGEDWDAQVFALPVRAISPPVSSPFGWHVVYLERKSEVATAALCEKAFQEHMGLVWATLEREVLSALHAGGDNFQALASGALGPRWVQVGGSAGRATFLRVEARNGDLATVRLHTEVAPPLFLPFVSDTACAASVEDTYHIDCAAGTSSLQRSDYYPLPLARGRPVSFPDAGQAQGPRPIQPDEVWAQQRALICP